jgi:hypothetical protein
MRGPTSGGSKIRLCACAMQGPVITVTIFLKVHELFPEKLMAPSKSPLVSFRLPLCACSRYQASRCRWCFHAFWYLAGLSFYTYGWNLGGIFPRVVVSIGLGCFAKLLAQFALLLSDFACVDAGLMSARMQHSSPQAFCPQSDPVIKQDQELFS